MRWWPFAMTTPDTLVAARLHSPLIIGHGQGEQFIASDVPAILAHTREVTYLQNGENRRSHARAGAHHAAGRRASSRTRVPPSSGMPPPRKRAAIAHFMLKEIHEQPTALAETLRGRLNDDRSGAVLPGLQLGAEELRRLGESADHRLRHRLSRRSGGQVRHRDGWRACRWRSTSPPSCAIATR